RTLQTPSISDLTRDARFDDAAHERRRDLARHPRDRPANSGHPDERLQRIDDPRTRDGRPTKFTPKALRVADPPRPNQQDAPLNAGVERPEHASNGHRPERELRAI